MHQYLTDCGVSTYPHGILHFLPDSKLLLYMQICVLLQVFVHVLVCVYLRALCNRGASYKNVPSHPLVT